jgi:hypothetical protein
MKRSIDDELDQVERVMASEERDVSTATKSALPDSLKQVILWVTVIVVVALVASTFLP